MFCSALFIIDKFTFSCYVLKNIPPLKIESDYFSIFLLMPVHTDLGFLARPPYRFNITKQLVCSIYQSSQ